MATASRQPAQRYVGPGVDQTFIPLEYVIPPEYRSVSLVGLAVTKRELNIPAFRTVVSRAWSITSLTSIHSLGKNFFAFVFSYSSDKVIVLNKGPWCFMDAHLVLKECPPSGILDDIDFTTSSFWVQAHKLPKPMQNAKTASLMAKCFHKLHKVDLIDYEDKSWDGFLRFKVDMKLTVPLVKGMVLKTFEMNPLWVQFKYERLPMFCALCGIIGHSKLICRNAINLSTTESFTAELRAVQPNYEEKMLRWNQLQSFLQMHSDVDIGCHAHETSVQDRFTSFQPLYMLMFEDHANETTNGPILFRAPEELVAHFEGAIRRSTKSFDEEHPDLPDMSPIQLPEIPAMPFPGSPTKEDWDYIDRHAMTQEELAQFNEELIKDVPCDFLNDEGVKSLRTLYFHAERVAKFFLKDLNDADKEWFKDACKYIKLDLQHCAYRIEEGVWNINIVDKFRRHELMDAVFNHYDDYPVSPY